MRITLIGFVCFCISVQLYSQRGVEAGAIIQPQIYGQYYLEEQENRALKIPYSFAIGVNAGYNFNDYWGLRTGFLYTPLGEKYNDISTSPEQAIEVNLDYIQVPLYLKLNSSPENRFSFLMIAGPHISFLNEARLTIDNEDPVFVIGEYARFIKGAAIGLGVQVNLDRGGNINFLWHNTMSLDNVAATGSADTRYVSTGMQLAYHYFITM